MSSFIVAVEPLLDCENPPFNSTHLFLSVFLIVGIIVSYLPQQLKIILSKSSDGLSPWYLMLGAISSISNLLNIVILQLPVFYCCFHEASLGRCLYNLLGLFQTITQVSMFLAVFLLFYIYFPAIPIESPENGRILREWKDSEKVSKIIAYYCLSSGLISILVGITFGVPSIVASLWTATLALVALISSTVQFIPQIRRTYKLKMVGALSIPAMMMQTPGSFLFCYTIAMNPGTNFTSWITYFFGGCLQGVLLSLCLYYNYTLPTEYERIEQDGNAPRSEY